MANTHKSSICSSLRFVFADSQTVCSLSPLFLLSLAAVLFSVFAAPAPDAAAVVVLYSCRFFLAWHLSFVFGVLSATQIT